MNKKIKIVLCIIILIAIISLLTVFIINKVKEEGREYEIPEIKEYNYFVMQENDKYGVIDKNGKIIVEPDYETVVIPNPVNNNAVHPEMPKMVIIILFLYLNKFLKVTFQVNDNLFQINLIFSNSTFLPFLGGSGLSNVAGTYLKSFKTVTKVTITIKDIVTKIIETHGITSA